jgi:hypothetical protein
MPIGGPKYDVFDRARDDYSYWEMVHKETVAKREAKRKESSKYIKTEIERIDRLIHILNSAYNAAEEKNYHASRNYLFTIFDDLIKIEQNMSHSQILEFISSHPMDYSIRVWIDLIRKDLRGTFEAEKTLFYEAVIKEEKEKKGLE